MDANKPMHKCHTMQEFCEKVRLRLSRSISCLVLELCTLFDREASEIATRHYLAIRDLHLWQLQLSKKVAIESNDSGCSVILVSNRTVDERT